MIIFKKKKIFNFILKSVYLFIYPFIFKIKNRFAEPNFEGKLKRSITFW